MRVTRFFSSRLRDLLVLLLFVGDSALTVASGIAAFWLRHDAVDFSDLQGDLLVSAAILMPLSFSFAGVYRRRRLESLSYAAQRILIGGVLALLLLLLLGYLTKTTGDVSRLWVILWAFLLPLSVLIERGVIRLLLSRLGASRALRRRVVLIGTDPLRSRVLKKMQENPERCSTTQVDVTHEINASAFASIPLLCQEVEKICSEERPPDDVLLAFPGDQLADLEAVVRGIRHHWVNIDVCPDHALSSLTFQDVRTIAGVPVLRLVSRPFEGWRGVAKWLEDKILILPLLIILSPLMLLIAVAIKLDSKGPVLFLQQRYGFDNNEITVLKFRTMYVQSCDDGSQQATRGDTRITRVGRVIRRLSLDELPQLLNVLSGSMSLIGPRPHAVPHNFEFAPMVQDYWSRHRIKPGMTGWAQVNGLRGEITDISDIQRRVEYDLYYIENWSLSFDVAILFRTFFLIFLDRSAY